MTPNIHYSFTIPSMLENAYIFAENFHNTVHDYKLSCEILID